jgi:hypothetical protein
MAGSGKAGTCRQHRGPVVAAGRWLPAAAPVTVCTGLPQRLAAAINPSRIEMPLPDDQT